MTDYQAKPEVWKGFENLYGVHNPFNPIHSEFVDSILELRARIEKLEEAENEWRFREAMSIIRSTTHEQLVELMGEEWLEEFRGVTTTSQKPHQDKLDRLIELDRGDSLAKRVQHAIYTEYARSKSTGQPEARAAIREVAVWLEEEFGPQIDWITTELREEAK